ncbi:uncharacterized protein TRIVIDRAFT_224390 [Trichoderma virens Gv29-8]|uniref:Uncharacterized protein n=1 Tax=Hypocrea virens (strain Gv29-8 / FGSC 10586) TaxID=413071 RepID=G9N018_HYPVG|nr:uncharacterized protein TRIVIDRAFT_224390 [Trichoderma virens Gv29-8]EHK20222.1 hypothetical protein TRIVIDRAFT_224390 [Trichoderma virens Gv29-8]UKZ45839.1 hypothetical protein TrVGV298_000032 [Trichoderma virens]
MYDIDGSDTSDTIYSTGKVPVIFHNEAGNSWIKAILLGSPFLEFDDLTYLSATDLFGTGTTCLVWTSATRWSNGDFSNAIRYVDLMNGIKSHLLTGWKNNMGLENMSTYRSSLSFYLSDESQGIAWATNPPVPIRCIEIVKVPRPY